jgi:iron complex outermembrane receptor protein
MRLRQARSAVVAALLVASMHGVAGAQTATAPTPPAFPPFSQDVFVTATVSELDGAPPRTTAVVRREDLQRLGITSIVEGLRLVPGLDPRARGPRDVQTDFSVRGATFGQSLILVDGFRMNNSQSGHHNGEIPVPLGAVDRVEVVYGASSAVHGADALGGTIQVISRQGDFATASTAFGQHGLASGEASFSGHVVPEHWTVVGWGSRSSGFDFDRDFALGGGMVRGELPHNVTMDVRHQRRAFGANGFYGPSPSKEWTDGTLAGATWKRAGVAWVGSVRGAYRLHHDHFRWDINRPGFAENRHKTDAVELNATLTRELGSGRRATVGLAAGGDQVTSSNLGDHDYARAGAFGELMLPISSQTTTNVGLRVDSYSTFGTSVSPSMGVSYQVMPELQLHASGSRAFRVPTFTELYYSDPSNLGNPDLVAEHGWSLDFGAVWTQSGWTFSATPFWRWDHDVIDWTRQSPAERWRSANIRDVSTRGFEAAIERRLDTSMVRIYYSLLDVDAPQLDMLSKYVLEYAKHQSGGSISVPFGHNFRVAVNVDHRHRVDGQSYQLMGARFSHRWGQVEAFVDGTNLLDEDYQEISGVVMPGRWITVGVSIQ